MYVADIRNVIFYNIHRYFVYCFTFVIKAVKYATSETVSLSQRLSDIAYFAYLTALMTNSFHCLCDSFYDKIFRFIVLFKAVSCV